MARGEYYGNYRKSPLLTRDRKVNRPSLDQGDSVSPGRGLKSLLYLPVFYDRQPERCPKCQNSHIEGLREPLSGNHLLGYQITWRCPICGTRGAQKRYGTPSTVFFVPWYKVLRGIGGSNYGHCRC